MEEILEVVDELAPDAPDEQTELECGDAPIKQEPLRPCDELIRLAESFPEILSSENPADIMNLDRYSELRALGLTEQEAYLATRRTRVREDNRAHLSPTVTREAKGPGSAMPDGELRACRELFLGMSDAEIRRLYKKVCAQP